MTLDRKECDKTRGTHKFDSQEKILGISEEHKVYLNTNNDSLDIDTTARKERELEMKRNREHPHSSKSLILVEKQIKIYEEPKEKNATKFIN